jgi:RNA polymerase primary sigma factor
VGGTKKRRQRSQTGIDHAKDKGGYGRILLDYIGDMSRYEPLSVQEERELFRRYHQGDKKAKEKIILSNLRFVFKVARKYANQGMLFMDLVSEGNRGLIHAVDRFDPDKNFKFISYAVWWVRQSILKAISSQSRMARVPLNQTQGIVKMFRSMDVLSQKGGRIPTVKEIADHSGLSEDFVEAMIVIVTPALSLESRISDREGSTTIADTLRSHEADPLDDMIAKSLSEGVLKAMDILTPMERRVIERSFGFCDGCRYTLKEMGSMLGVSKERARQVRERAVKKIQYALGGNGGDR